MTIDLLLPNRPNMALLALATVCSALTSPLRAQCVSAQHRVIVNRTNVCTEGAGDLLTLLRRHTSRYRLALDAESSDQQPLVLLDGVAVDGGAQRLKDISVEHVQSVIVLRPADAVARYGTKARKGAILVMTKDGAAPFAGP